MFGSWPTWLVFLLYFTLAGTVIFFTIKASNHIDEIDRKTNIGSAVLGGIMLAAVTSLPELITSIASSIGLGMETAKPELAIGNIFGSNIFNMMILGIADVIFIRKTYLLNVGKGNRVSNYLTLGMYGFLGIFIAIIKIFFKGFQGIPHLWFSLLSVGILGIYALNVVLSRKVSLEEASEEKEVSSVKKNVLYFIIWSCCLVVSSVFITIATDEINNRLQLDANFAGALFLGVATSLPELTSVINLVRLNNYESAISGITGSSLFNITIISFVDIITPVNIYSFIYGGESKNAIILLILGLIGVLILLYTFLRKQCKNKILYIIPSVLLIANYLMYIILSTI